MKHIFILSFILIYSINSFSQQYEFEALTDNYIPLVDPISFTNEECWDEVNFILNTDLPIDQWFENPVSQITIQDSRVIIGDIINGDVLAPFSTNLVCNGTDPTVSNIGYEFGTDATTGESLMKIEWKESGFAYLEGFFDLINFQCWIYASGVIEFHYGVGATSLAEIAYVENGDTFGGLCGISNGFAEAYYLEGPSEAYTFKFGPINPNDLPLLTSFPEEGTVYRFSPKQSSGIASQVNSNNILLVNSLVANQLHLDFKHSPTSCDYIIINSYGVELEKGSVSSELPKLELNQLTSGIYFLKILYEGEIRSFKFFKI